MPDQGSSFIPKNANRLEKRASSTHRIYLLSYLSYVFFFGTLIAAVAVYLYAIHVEGQLQNVKNDLEIARARFSEQSIETVRSLEKKLLAADQLLNESAAPSRIFADIEAVVSSEVRFSGFKYERLPGQQFRVTLSGRADDFNQILYQHSLMGSSPIFKNAEIIEYDYNLAEAEGNSGDAKLTLPSSNASLSFVFADTLAIGEIAYEPVAVQSGAVVDNVVIDPEAPDAAEDIPVEDVITTTTEI